MYMLSGPPFTAADREGRLVRDGRGELVRPHSMHTDLTSDLWTVRQGLLVRHAFTHLSLDAAATSLPNAFTFQVRLMGASHDILREVVTSERFQQTEIAMVSRCDYPPWAAACMRLFEAAPGVTLADATTYSVHSAVERVYDACMLVANQSDCSTTAERTNHIHM